MKNNNLTKKLTIWAIIIAAILMIPFFGQFPWTLGDYIFAGTVLFVLATVYELITKNMRSTKQKLIVAAIILGIIVLIIGWAATGPENEAMLNQMK